MKRMGMRPGRALWGLVLAVAAIVAPSNAVAEAQPAAVEKLDALGKAFAGKSFAATYEMVVTQPAAPEQRMAFNLLAGPPNRLRLEAADAAMAENMPVLTADGKLITIFFPPAAVTHTTQTATLESGQIDVLLRNIMFAGVGADVVLALTQPDPALALRDVMSSVTLVGEEQIDGQTAVHLRTQLELAMPMASGAPPQVPSDVWLTAGGEPRLLRIQHDPSALPGATDGPARQRPAMRLDFKTWDLAPKLEQTSFTAQVPAGATTYATLIDGIRAQMEAERSNSSDDPAAKLVGKPAPDFTLELLKGGEVQLSKLRGKVVVLDFWATWCPPCRESLPKLDLIGKTYASKGVELYTINLREEKDEITKFMEDRKFDFQVALDKEGATAETYGVQGIPMTVIIDQQGQVADVHVGAAPDLAEVLTATLDKLIAGQ